MNNSSKTLLGDFIVIFDVNGCLKNYQTLINDLVWPPIPNIQDSAVSFISISDNIALCFRGNINYQNKASGFGVGLYQFIDDVDTETFNSNMIDSALSGSSIDPGNRGKYAAFVGSAQSQQFFAITDPQRKIPLYYYADNQRFFVATDLRIITKILPQKARVCNKAIYHHLNYAYIPTPFTIFEKIYKIRPGCVLNYHCGNIKETEHFVLDYTENIDDTEAQQTKLLQDEVVRVVEDYGKINTSWATFLSGGTDSSSITGILAKKYGGKSTSSYSIGFEEVAFDEMEYAEIAAKHYDLNAHFKKVSAQDAMACISQLVLAYDEPFGNSSAIPTYYCAKMAADHGHTTMIAGDGGDEIYGGNDRYGKDIIFERFYQMPAFIKFLAHGGAAALKPIDTRFINRIKNFIHRGSLPNPERFYTDDSFASDFYSDLLSKDFRSSVEKNDSLGVIQAVYDRAKAKTELNKLMYIDLQMAIADNDLTKVNRAAKLAGISVLYPYLDNDLLHYTAKIPANLKVCGGQKRYLFKKAMAGILPEAILTKKKQGFGLPVGEWFRTHDDFKSLIYDILLSEKSLSRGYFNPDFIKSLAIRHQKNVWDYTQELWLLIMLELWHREYIDE